MWDFNIIIFLFISCHSSLQGQHENWKEFLWCNGYFFFLPLFWFIEVQLRQKVTHKHQNRRNFWKEQHGCSRKMSCRSSSHHSKVGQLLFPHTSIHTKYWSFPMQTWTSITMATASKLWSICVNRYKNKIKNSPNSSPTPIMCSSQKYKLKYYFLHF